MIVVYASELAACIGLNRYKPIHEAAVSVFQRSFPLRYENALKRHGGAEDKFTEQSHDADSDDSYETEPASSSVAADTLLDELCALDSQQSEGTTSYTESGMELRTPILSKVRAFNRSIGCVDNFYKKLITYEVGLILLGGRVDGMGEEGDLEIVKKRLHRFFSSSPVYERVQTQAYMFLTDTKQCSLVQLFRGEKVTEIVAFDELFWAAVIKRLTEFAAALHAVAESEQKQDLLIAAHRFRVRWSPSLLSGSS